jgi:hypothetical protein
MVEVRPEIDFMSLEEVLVLQTGAEPAGDSP